MGSSFLPIKLIEVTSQRHFLKEHVRGLGVQERCVSPGESSGGVEWARGHRPAQVLVYLPTGEVVSSYNSLERILRGLGWERYYGGDPDLFQFHKSSSIDLISLPREFSKFTSIYMYDLVIKNPNIFHVRD
ncbi:Flowering-promoting factor 1-like protein 2 [Vitis vinifera]|uniref:Flowering-promoting factor 1-like protein 2 n=1 Tax=Vitis vinifera TaxID=29760 RepID=A0A438K877_VITVI|nr:Flowering-promoting factor 1-like protein 2 [Vitis vinifera]